MTVIPNDFTGNCHLEDNGKISFYGGPGHLQYDLWSFSRKATQPPNQI